ncbi:hypothetical protein HYV22_04540 [Candidatus Gottesmanbacteria bacterium]|nr:hypothetical protein [Candidatus Gottesmanbacteria bacterium]
MRSMKEDNKPIDIPMLMPERLVDVDVVVWDMDGSLYRHDGERGTFKESSLERAVTRSAIRFIMDREGIDEVTAMTFYEETLLDEVGTSRVLAARYGITRKEYFDVVWDLDPKGIVRDFEIPKRVVKKFAELGKQQILLTAAPEAWQKRVLSFLEIEEMFFRRYNAEMFGKKDEVFADLAREFNPARVLSIGDQIHSDIAPAFAVGLRVFHVSHPQALLTLMGGEST